MGYREIVIFVMVGLSPQINAKSSIDISFNANFSYTWRSDLTNLRGVAFVNANCLKGGDCHLNMASFEGCIGGKNTLAKKFPGLIELSSTNEPNDYFSVKSDGRSIIIKSRLDNFDIRSKNCDLSGLRCEYSLASLVAFEEDPTGKKRKLQVTILDKDLKNSSNFPICD